MNGYDLLQVIIALFFLTLFTPILGAFFHKSLSGESTLLSKLARPFESVLYKIMDVDEKEEMGWSEYLKAVLIFNITGFLFVFFVLIFQKSLPLNPAGFPGLCWHLAFNTAVSFMTNTNWQSYAGEVTMSHFSQMVALTGQNFLSAATGLSVMLVLVRAFKRSQTKKLGNFLP
jgi:K+-transporting ATPase ATPase A chain